MFVRWYRRVEIKLSHTGTLQVHTLHATPSRKGLVVRFDGSAGGKGSVGDFDAGRSRSCLNQYRPSFLNLLAWKWWLTQAFPLSILSSNFYFYWNPSKTFGWASSFGWLPGQLVDPQICGFNGLVITHLSNRGRRPSKVTPFLVCDGGINMYMTTTEKVHPPTRGRGVAA